MQGEGREDKAACPLGFLGQSNELGSPRWFSFRVASTTVPGCVRTRQAQPWLQMQGGGQEPAVSALLRQVYFGRGIFLGLPCGWLWILQHSGCWQEQNSQQITFFSRNFSDFWGVIWWQILTVLSWVVEDHCKNCLLRGLCIPYFPLWFFHDPWYKEPRGKARCSFQ